MNYKKSHLIFMKIYRKQRKKRFLVLLNNNSDSIFAHERKKLSHMGADKK